MKHFLSILILSFLSTLTIAGTNSVYEITADADMNETFDSVYQELEQRNFYVIFEANIGKNLSCFKEKWGVNYNKNNLGGIRSMAIL
ncbi:MAG: hypothetical protein ABGX33_05790 [Cycloclasticus sp.]